MIGHDAARLGEAESFLKENITCRRGRFPSSLSSKFGLALIHDFSSAGLRTRAPGLSNRSSLKLEREADFSAFEESLVV